MCACACACVCVCVCVLHGMGRTVFSVVRMFAFMLHMLTLGMLNKLSCHAHF